MKKTLGVVAAAAMAATPMLGVVATGQSVNDTVTVSATVNDTLTLECTDVTIETMAVGETKTGSGTCTVFSTKVNGWSLDSSDGTALTGYADNGYTTVNGDKFDKHTSGQTLTAGTWAISKDGQAGPEAVDGTQVASSNKFSKTASADTTPGNQTVSITYSAAARSNQISGYYKGTVKYTLTNAE